MFGSTEHTKFQQFLFGYLDDLIIVTKDFAMHEQLLEMILKRLRDAELMAKLKNVNLVVEE